MTQLQPTNPAKPTLKNIKKFIVGWSRYILYKLFYQGHVSRLGEDSKDVMFLPKHQMEQFVWRQQIMNPLCLAQGKCVICGCQTPQLQMAGEACEGNCYPEMMDKKEWENYKKENQIEI